MEVNKFVWGMDKGIDKVSHSTKSLKLGLRREGKDLKRNPEWQL